MRLNSPGRVSLSCGLSEVSAARIGKITMKSGGAEVRILRQETPKNNVQGLIMTEARKIADMSEPGSELVGFVWIGIFSDNRTATGAHINSSTIPFNRAMIPAFVSEVLRRDLITSHEADEVACDVVNRANGFLPDPAS